MEIIGDQITLHRVTTGFWSLDRAFMNLKGKVGFPVRGICELYGPTGAGKSTTAYCLSARIAKELGSNISLADLEMYDPEFLVDLLDNVGFGGKLHLVDGPTDEKLLDALIDDLRSEDYCVGILDSLGAISPIADVEGNTGDANMGRRARIAAQLARRVTHAIRGKSIPSVLFITNHQLKQMGGKFSQGNTTSGGDVKKYLATVRLSIRILKTYDDGSTLITGKVDKNRFGYSKRSFYLFNKAGWGIHPGLTAVMDCVFAGLAEQERTVKLGGKSFGYFSTIAEKADDNEMFQPFMAALAEYHGEIKTPKSKDEEEE